MTVLLVNGLGLDNVDLSQFDKVQADQKIVFIDNEDLISSFDDKWGVRFIDDIYQVLETVDNFYNRGYKVIVADHDGNGRYLCRRVRKHTNTTRFSVN